MLQKACGWLWGSVWLLPALAGWGAEKVFDFGTYPLNRPPAGFRSLLAGQGTPGEWKVIEADVPSLLTPFSPGAKPTLRQAAVAQLSRDKTDERFPILMFEEETFGDFTLTTRFKIVDGQEEQMAGIAFAIQDENNYSYVRASALGGTFSLFRVVGGVRSAPVSLRVDIPKGQWHEMKVEWKDKVIRASLNNRYTLPEQPEKSDHLGRLGFWTKSDSVAWFADTRITYRPRENLAQTLVREALLQYPRVLDLQIYAPTLTNETVLRVVASKHPSQLGQPAPDGTRDVLAGKGFLYDRTREEVVIVLPLRDWNGDPVAAVRVQMKSFPGQTENNAIGRAMPILQGMAGRIQSARSLVE
jgi:hypothetical protein